FSIHVFKEVRRDLPTYEIFDNLILKAAALGVVFQPQTVICDFETALIPAVQASFPGVQMQGCYFHFCQAVLRKVAELGLRTSKIVTRRLGNCISLQPRQKAFRSGTDGAFDNITTLTTIIREAHKSGKKLNIVCVDFAKAFGTVNHSSIDRPLRMHGLDTDSRALIWEMVTGSTIVIKGDGGVFSNKIEINQGDPISPLLFNSVMDELIELLEQSGVGYKIGSNKVVTLAFADDVTLVSSSRRGMEKLLSITHDFVNERGLGVNIKRCKGIRFVRTPKTKSLVQDTSKAFKVPDAGEEHIYILMAGPGELIKVLGVSITPDGKPSFNLDTLEGTLERIRKAPLKPARKLATVRDYLIPAMEYKLGFPGILPYTQGLNSCKIEYPLQLDRNSVTKRLIRESNSEIPFPLSSSTQSYSKHFLFCSLWLMYLSCILYQVVAGFGPIRCVHRGTYWYLLRVTTLDCWQPCEPGHWMVLSRLYPNFIKNCLIESTATDIVTCRVNLNPETIICDFETALIPVIQGYFPNTRVQGCYFHFYQAVHRKVGELGLKTRYRMEEATRRKIRMLLATAFLPVPGVRLLEAGTTDILSTFLTSNPEVHIKYSSNKFSYKSLEHDFTYNQERDKIITDILRIQSDGPKSARDYNLKNRYGVLKIGEENKLIRLGKNEAIRCIASIEEMFDVINDAHQKIGHECHKKRARKLPKSLVVKPLVSTNLMSRAQVDLINFQTMPDGDFKYIMTYLNHFTKFCILSPLKSKRAE
ncbi:Retrovirus-related Pol polyprotein from type-2 retrotransposable element R2DM, partial [Trichinella spiralis]